MLDSINAQGLINEQEKEQVRRAVKYIRGEVLVDTGEVRYIAKTSNNKMSIKVNGNKLSFHGSLSQYYNEDYTSLLWNEVPLAIRKLEIDLGIDLSNFQITQIDLEGTFKVSDNPASYYEFLGVTGYFKRFILGTTLYYTTKNRKIMIYDKSKKIKEDSLYKKSIARNLLRIETRFSKPFFIRRLKRVIESEFLISDLYKPNVQKSLLNLWLEGYDKINKIKNLKTIQMDGIHGLKDLKKKLMVRGIQSLGGSEEVIGMIKRSANNDSKLNSKVIYRISQGLLSIGNDDINVIPNRHLEELDWRILCTYFKYYESIK